eukprot:TRINITY_DN68573_c0_g1_i1.p1 TRINITY_DN68573_c0_g1~~TRINITY_DN68573_c0_g1_i1.p1  ORF type:complete len:530 (-),score=53.27 TRINITY_DN68573_c0_g1_i1:47-1636(-)
MVVWPGGPLVLPIANVAIQQPDFYVYRDDVVVFPISYSVPKHWIVPSLPAKDRFLINDSLASFYTRTYKFAPFEEGRYHLHVQRHRFGDTRRKGGYDCLRHYELLANGCVPIFDDLENTPPSVLTSLPRSLLFRAKALHALPWTDTDTGRGECLVSAGCTPGAYETLASELLNYTSQHLSTEAAARSFLAAVNIHRGDKVLFLPCSGMDVFPSYLTASIFHGLVSVLGDDVIDVPTYEYAYKYPGPLYSPEEYRLRYDMWGQGFTLGFQLPRRPYLNRANLSARIRALEFSLIVFARMSPYEPCNFCCSLGDRTGGSVPEFMEDVLGRYPPERVALLFGDDSGLHDANVRTQAARVGALHRGFGFVFMRELLPFAGVGPSSEVLRPVDGRLLQPGCFHEEWLDFFKRWHVDGSALLSCVGNGWCTDPEIDDLFKSRYFEMQRPSQDPVILHHFCRTGFVLRTGLLARHYGTEACREDFECFGACSFSVKYYARGLLEVPRELFLEEFGLEVGDIIIMLARTCPGDVYAT